MWRRTLAVLPSIGVSLLPKLMVRCVGLLMQDLYRRSA
jgi:hypothetical protein